MATRTDPSDPWVSVKIRESTRARLQDLKIHPRQSHDEVINALIDIDETLDNARDTP